MPLEDYIDDLKPLCVYALGKDWAYAAAICERESGGNEWAIGDSGAARGLWQMHADFVATYVTHFSQSGTVLVEHHDTFVQAEPLKRFWNSFAPDFDRKERLRIYHYGATGAERLSHTDDPDPDGYVDSVMEIFASIPQPKPDKASKK